MGKIFVAYLLPHPTDVFNLLEDGIQWCARGETREIAEQNLRGKFAEQMRDEHYAEEETEKVWKSHTLFVMEV